MLGLFTNKMITQRIDQLDIHQRYLLYKLLPKLIWSLTESCEIMVLIIRKQSRYDRCIHFIDFMSYFTAFVTSTELKGSLVYFVKRRLRFESKLAPKFGKILDKFDAGALFQFERSVIDLLVVA